MSQMLWILKTLLSHWLRHPAQLAAFAIGLMSATALWSGVQAINLHARASYDRAASAIGGDNGVMLAPTSGQDVPQSVFAELRRAGWMVSPVIEGRVRVRDRQIRLIGIEPVSLPRSAGLAPSMADTTLQPFLSSAGQTIVAPETAAELGLIEGATISTEAGLALPPIRIVAEAVPDVLVMDIGQAQRLLNRMDRVSRFIVDPETVGPRRPLAEVTGDRLKLVQTEDGSDLQRLTASFHLNLTAFGFLSFVVGLFITHSAIGLVCEQRLATIRTLRACGVSLRKVIMVMLIELLVLSAAAGAAGLIGGYVIARLLLPDIAASLRGLYGAGVSSRLIVSPQWWTIGIAVAIAGALVAAAHAFYRVYRLPVLVSAQPYAWQEAQQRWRLWQGLFAVAALIVSGVSLIYGEGLVAGFVVLGGVMIAAALLLPVVLSALLQTGERLTRRPLAHWIWADSRLQLSGLSMALMALLLALAVNIGVSTMVGSFNSAFLRWLDGRLLADVYVAGRDNRQTGEIETWLRSRSDVVAVLPMARTEATIESETIELFGLADDPALRSAWPLLQGERDAWNALRDGAGVLVSEQLSRRMKLEPGSGIRIPLPSGVDWRVQVVGVYADYGNPKGQLSVNVDQLVARFPGADRTRLGLRVSPGSGAALMSELERRFELSGRSLADQATVKAEARRIFGRTFAVTAALNAFTLGVAGIALLMSLLSLADARLPQLAPLWAMGVPGRTLAMLEFAKTVMLALLTALLALPLGLFVAWCLIEIVNVKAFGWRLPFSVFPFDLVKLVVVAVLAACIASLIPIVRLARVRPAAFLKTFANES